MKQTTTAVVILFTSVLVFSSCAKKKDDDCKTCTAKNQVTGAVIETKQVCTDQEESQFRMRYPDTPVTCQ